MSDGTQALFRPAPARATRPTASTAGRRQRLQRYPASAYQQSAPAESERLRPLARLAGREAVFAVVFEHRGSDALAALVLDADQQLRFMDYRGNAADESSVWRVDDGGQFYPDAFDILFALQGLEIGVEWQGAEGSSLHVLRANGHRLREVLEGYFYRSV